MASPRFPTVKTFKKLSYQGLEVLRDTHLVGLEYVKFNVENVNTGHSQIYFINTKTHRAHMRFMAAAGLPRGGGQMRGVLIYRPLSKAPNGELGVYTFEFEPSDSYSFEMIKIAHDLLVAKMPIAKRSDWVLPIMGGDRYLWTGEETV